LALWTLGSVVRPFSDMVGTPDMRSRYGAFTPGKGL
jgi:hypothetical protein